MVPSAPCIVPKLDFPISGVIGCFRDEGVISCGGHCCGIAMHEGLGRDMKIPEHLVTVVASDEIDLVGVDVLQKEGHRTVGVKGSGRDVTDGDAKTVVDGVTGAAEHGGDLGTTYQASPGGWVYGTDGYSFQVAAGL